MDSSLGLLLPFSFDSSSSQRLPNHPQATLLFSLIFVLLRLIVTWVIPCYYVLGYACFWRFNHRTYEGLHWFFTDMSVEVAGIELCTEALFEKFLSFRYDFLHIQNCIKIEPHLALLYLKIFLRWPNLTWN